VREQHRNQVFPLLNCVDVEIAHSSVKHWDLLAPFVEALLCSSDLQTEYLSRFLSVGIRIVEKCNQLFNGGLCHTYPLWDGSSTVGTRHGDIGVDAFLFALRRAGKGKIPALREWLSQQIAITITLPRTIRR
jgi:hypothetical protein